MVHGSKLRLPANVPGRTENLGQKRVQCSACQSLMSIESYNNADPDSADLEWGLRWHISRVFPDDADERGHTLSD